MREFLSKMFKIDTSKKILWIVTATWLVSVVVNYTMAYLNIESNIIISTFTVVNTAFMLELGYYGAKSGIENVTKIRNNKQV